jgi:hypothetical protein
MQGGARPAVRDDDGRTSGPIAAPRAVGPAARPLIDRGRFHPKFDELGGRRPARGRGDAITRVFGGRRPCLSHLARIAPGRVVDAIGLSREARQR